MCLTVHAWPPPPPFPSQNVVYFSVQDRDGGIFWRSMHDSPFPQKNSVTLSLFFSTKSGRGICLMDLAFPLCPTTKFYDTIPFFQYKIGTRDVFEGQFMTLFFHKISWHYPYFSVQNWDEGCVWREASPSLDWQDPLPSQHLQLWQLQVSRYQHLPENNSKIYKFFPPWRMWLQDRFEDSLRAQFCW